MSAQTPEEGGGGERSAGGREGMSEVGREITHTNVQ